MPTSSNTTDRCIEVRSLVHRYSSDGFAIHIDDLSVESGSAVACIGPSGCGKSTFLNLVAGILPAPPASLWVHGVDSASRSDAERRRFRATRIGLVFQEFELLEHLSVRENILLPYYVNPALSLDGAVRARCEQLAHETSIVEHLDRGPSVLSQGERQRVAICRALINQPDIVLADEPTGNLDPDATDTALDLLLNQVRQVSSTLVLVTHDHSLLDRFDRVIDFREFRG